MLTAPADQADPARYLPLLGIATELTASSRLKQRMGMVAEPYKAGRGGAYLRAGQVLSVAGAAGSVLARRSRLAGCRLRLPRSRVQLAHHGPRRAIPCLERALGACLLVIYQRE